MIRLRDAQTQTSFRQQEEDKEEEEEATNGCGYRLSVRHLAKNFV